MAPKSIVARKADARARLRAEGFTAIEAVLHRDDIASLDEIKARFGITSRSDVLRLVLAKFDPQTLTPEDVALLTKQAA